MPAYKYQTSKGKTMWYANFYYEDWTGEKQRKCKRGFSRKSDAEKYEREFLDKFSTDPTILFSSLVENYLSDMETRLKPTTLDNKKYIIESKVLPYFGKKKICDIDENMVRRWQNSLIEYRNDKGEPYSPTYLRTVHNQLSTIMNYAMKFYKLRYNPCHTAGTIGKSRADEMNIWTQEKFSQVIEFEDSPEYNLVFRLLFYSGAREGEILALTPQDIPRDNALIDINKNYAVVKGAEYFLTPKTDRSVRKVTIPKSLHTDLLNFIDGMYIDDDERIFYFQKHGLTKRFQKMMTNAGIEKDSEEWLRIHDLRHSHASMLINMKKAIEEISRRLGHDSIKTTWDTYSHLYPGSDRVLADDIEKLILKESQEKDDSFHAAPDYTPTAISPLCRDSQFILDKISSEVNPLVHQNNVKIFLRYGIDIDKEIILGFKMAAYVDYVSHGNTIINLITEFRPNENLRNLLLSMFTEAVSTCELTNSNISKLDEQMTRVTIPHYSKIYNTKYET